MKLIFGLGNPGGKFEQTRHNIGFMVVDKLVKHKLPVIPSIHAWKKNEKFGCELCKLDNNIIIVKPQTYMNLTGLAVSRLTGFYKIGPEDVWVIHDDIDLPIGKIRIRKGGASAGHHGIESIMKEWGESEFFRFRLGIGKGKLDVHKTMDKNLHRQDIEKFVIAPFRDFEGGEVKKLIKHTVEAIELALDKGIEKAMNRFN